VSTDKTAAAETLAPLPDLPGPAGQQPSSASATVPAADDSTGPGMPSWADLHERADDDLAAVRAHAGIAMEGIARDHAAALDALDEPPRIQRQERPVSDQGQPFTVAAGSFLAAAACPSCGYGLGGRSCVHVLAGRGANRTAVAIHEECSGEAL
jgi:hypothetical protein